MSSDRIIGFLGNHGGLQAQNTLLEEVVQSHALSGQLLRFIAWNNRLPVVFRAAEVTSVGKDHSARGMIFDIAVQRLQVIWCTKIVGVLDRNPVCICIAHSQIASGGWTAIVLIKITQSGAIPL